MKAQSPLKAQWNQISEAFNQKTQRERNIVALLVLVVCYGVFEVVFFSAITKEKKALDDRMTYAQKEVKNLSAQELVFAQALANDPNTTKKLEIERLELRTIELDNNLEKLSVGLIPAEKLPQALHDVLQNMSDLKLVGMQTLAPTKLQLESPEIQNEDELEKAVAAAKGEQKTQEDSIGVFKHSVAVSVEGKYFDVVRYIQALESLPWKIYWEGLDYQVNKYPKAKVTIEVYTLSTDKGVLGV